MCSPATACRSSKRQSGRPRELPCGTVRGTLRRECLDHLLIHGERHLRQILTEYAQHYNDHRPHQAREQRAPLYEPGKAIDLTTRIKRRQTVQGSINEYARAA
jgi:putative transposase